MSYRILTEYSDVGKQGNKHECTENEHGDNNASSSIGLAMATACGVFPRPLQVLAEAVTALEMWELERVDGFGDERDSTARTLIDAAAAYSNQWDKCDAEVMDHD